jgi:hypothetical protein
MEFFMIQIDVTMVPTIDSVENSFECHVQFINLRYREIFAFFQDCLDQNLILNLTDYVLENDQTDQSDRTTYYSTTMENAQAFEQKFQDLTADFSMRKFWNQAGFETTTSIKEIDFNSVGYLTAPDTQVKVQVVNTDHSEIWGISFPHY